MLSVIGFAASDVHAVTLDWKGYFRADNNYMRNYQMDSAATGNSNAGVTGEYIRGQGSKSATYTTFFAKFKPSALINDNIIVHSEWNIGDPVYGFFGRGVPTVDRDNPLASGRNMLGLDAARLWMDAHTDFGLVQVGRAPMHWGLGVIFHSGDEPFDRFQSTFDTIRFTSKFGYLSIMPMYAKHNVGKSLAGSRDTTSVAGTTTITNGSDDVTDYGIALKFHNPEDELEAGFLFFKRNASDQQDALYYPHTVASPSKTQTAGPNGMNMRLLDLYAKKTWYRLTVMGEMPHLSGAIGDVNGAGKRNQIKATAFASEVRLDFDRWHHMLRFGTTPGQEAVTAGARGDRYSALYFHRNYKLGQILFRYNLGGYGGTNPDNFTNPESPYDAAIVNAKYLMLATENRGEQWSWSVGLVWAKANETAQQGKDFYNHRTRSYGGVAAVESQSDSLGWEIDLGLGYHWDENIRFGTDVGFFFPGEYYAFDNSILRTGKHDMVFGVTFSAMAKF